MNFVIGVLTVGCRNYDESISRLKICQNSIGILKESRLSNCRQQYVENQRSMPSVFVLKNASEECERMIHNSFISKVSSIS